jgi:hypothetical protein
MTPGILSPRELCDLLNYVLGLPERLGGPAISVCVVSSWPTKTRFQVEGLCDARLRNCGLGPTIKFGRRGPRSGPRQVPHEILAWVPAVWKKAQA